jgi:type IV pilus assembly protein PilF
MATFPRIKQSLFLSGGAMPSKIQIRTVCLLIFSMLILTSCASKEKELKNKQASLYFGAGTQSLIDRQYTEALKNLLEANKLDPDNAEILNNLGMAYYFKGEKDLAVQHLNRALKFDDKNSDAKLNLASIYFKDNEIDKAERFYKQVLKDLTYDKQARTLYNLGVLEVTARNNNVAAENYFKQSIKEDDNYCPSYYQLGLIQYKRRQFNSSLKNFKEASMGSCYETPAPHYYQALTLIELKRYDDARFKLDEIDSRFKKSVYAAKARQKSVELQSIEKYKSTESHASRKVLESPDF